MIAVKIVVFESTYMFPYGNPRKTITSQIEGMASSGGAIEARLWRPKGRDHVEPLF